MLEDTKNKSQYDVHVHSSQQSSGRARDLRDAFERSQDRENVLGMNSCAIESLTLVPRAWKAHLAEWMVSTRTMCQTWPNTMDIVMHRNSMDYESTGVLSTNKMSQLRNMPETQICGISVSWGVNKRFLQDCIPVRAWNSLSPFYSVRYELRKWMKLTSGWWCGIRMYLI